MPFRFPGFKSAAAQGGIPTQPRKLRRWLEELPMVNMGDATRQFFEGLRALNDTELPPADRLELMETLRPTASSVLDHLGRHFLNRSLPLPEKSQRIAELNRTLLNQLSLGYEMVVEGLVKGGNARQLEKHLARACYRALRYRSATLIHAWRLYAPSPDNLWSGIHGLYKAAETHGTQDKRIPDDRLHQQDRGSVADAYVRTCTLALAHPPSLRMGELDRVSDYLEAAAHTAVIVDSPMPDKSNGVYMVDLDSGQGPGHVNMADLPRGPGVRLLNLTPLIHELRETLQHGGKPRATDMSTDLMRRLVDGWSHIGKRRFSRAHRDDEINVAIGLANIHGAIAEELEQVYGTPESKNDFGDLSLQAITDNHRSDTQGQFLAQTDALGDSDAWDMVGRGNVVTDAYLTNKRNNNNARGQVPIRAIGLGSIDGEAWQVVNASAGGFCLRWQGHQTSRAQVGELIGLREKEGSHYQWRVGLIRWMLNKAERGLEIGVQVLAPKTLLITLESSSMGQPAGNPVEALMLPAIKTIQQPPTLLVPARRFRVGDQVIVNLAGRAMRVKLSSLGEQTSLFSQFRYASLGNVQEPEEPRAKPDEGFDEVWTLI